MTSEAKNIVDSPWIDIEAVKKRYGIKSPQTIMKYRKMGLFVWRWIGGVKIHKDRTDEMFLLHPKLKKVYNRKEKK